MPLVTQSKGSLSGGVNQQAAVLRHDSQVEEMINCVPTLDAGLRMRNSTAPIPVYDVDGVLSKVSFPTGVTSAFVYEYDRGSIGERPSELAFTITKDGGLEIIDLTLRQEMGDDGQELLAGTIYKDGAGISYQDDDARAYFARFAGRNGFAMTTVKDTTFVVNKTVTPRMLATTNDEENPTIDYGSVEVRYNFVGGDNPEAVPLGVVNGVGEFVVPVGAFNIKYCMIGGGGGGFSGGYTAGGGYAGSRKSDFGISLNDGEHLPFSLGAGGSGSGVSGKATTFNGEVARGGGAGNGFSAYSGNGGGGVTCDDYSNDGIRALYNDGSLTYFAYGGQRSLGDGGNGSAGGTGGTGGTGAGGGGGSVYGTGGRGGSGALNIAWGTIDEGSTAYLRSGYIWIKSADVVNKGYGYGATLMIEGANGNMTPPIVIAPTTPNLDGSISGATDLASAINSALGARGSASSDGNIIAITLVEGADGESFEKLIAVESSDTFGNMASFGWAHNVDSLSELPSSMASFFPVVRVGTERDANYWLHYSEGSWREHRDPSIHTAIDPKTMPHIITRVFDEKLNRWDYKVSRYVWNNRKVGDNITNKLPSFAVPHNNPPNGTNTVVIKDVFFFRNRLGLITDRSIVMSEVGEYGNFFRTTVAALLDGDRIDANVESVNSVELEYSILLEDSVMLFADKAQFRFSGGDILSPASYKIQQEMAYDVNITVRPLFMNDSVFFVADRDRYSAVYQMMISDDSGKSSTAVDLTEHCQSYIDNRIERITGSAVENMLFLTSDKTAELQHGVPISGRDTVYVYRYLDAGRQRQQSAWSKWTFNGTVISGFAIASKFYIMIDRIDALIVDDWILGTGQWEMNKPWRDYGRWIMSPESLEHYQQFERLPIHPKDTSSTFLDNYATKVEAQIVLGEFVYGTDGNKDNRGKTQMKSIEIITDWTSGVQIDVYDSNRALHRNVPSSKVKGRRPMIYGDSKNVMVVLKNDGTKGFRVDSLSYEVRVNKRATTH